MNEFESLQRYQWEDQLIEAQALALIAKEPACTGLLISRQFNWDPKDGKRPSLRWANQLAAESVGIPRSTFMKHLKVLKEQGFLVSINGNLCPSLPADHEEIKRAFQTLVADLTEAHRGDKPARRGDFLPHWSPRRSRSGIGESSSCNPFTDDPCTDDLCTEDSLSEVDASHPAHSGGNVYQEEQPPLPPDPSRGTSFFSLTSWWRRMASKTHSAAM